MLTNERSVSYLTNNPGNSELVQLKLNIRASDGDSTPSEVKRGTPAYINGFQIRLLEFKFRNQLVTPEEMEVVMEMLKQITEKDRARIEEILQNHPSGIAMAERFAAKAAAEAAAKTAAEVKLETARAALLEGLEIDVVAKITGLGREDIIKLKNELN